MTHRYSLAGTFAALLLAIAALAAPVEAQTGKLTGVVTDQQTGQPIPGAQITVEELGRSILTNERGVYFLINIPPGVYTVTAQVLGYATVRRTNVQVSIDVTTSQDFALAPQAVAVQEIVVEADRVPLVPRGQTATVQMITSAEIDALPVTDIMGVLELEQGFLHVPVDNTDVVSYAQQRQGVTSLRIRGGRGAETATLIDGIPINNFVLGGPAFDITNKAIQQVAVLKGAADPSYGNALSGVINYATRDGTPTLQGEVEYRSSAVGAWLGNKYDDTRAWDMFEGVISGPVPGTNSKLRFMFAGRQRYGADRAFQFDDDVFNPSRPSDAFNAPHALDVIPGWRAAGYNEQRDAFSKITFIPTPAARLGFSWITYRRENKSFDFDWLLAVDPLPFMKTAEDSAYYLARPGLLNYQFLAQNALRLKRDLFVAKWDHTLNRTAYSIALGYFDQSRLTCNFMSGVCLGTHFEDPNFSGGFVAPGPSPYSRTPTAGTDYFYGGEKLKTYTARFDINSQVSDHHHLSAGVFFQQHDLLYDEWANRGTNDVIVVEERYAAKPWDGAFYIQDKIEYDFITVMLGARFDYGKASGLFFANPVDPTNGTTALEVCRNPAEWQNKKIRSYDPESGKIITEILSADLSWTAQSCGDVELRNRAAKIATADDFAEAKARTQFSPRIGVSFPVTESSQLYFNFGRYSQNPILKNLYQATGIGTPREGTTAGPALFATGYDIPFLGNPHLLTEQATTYEIGYAHELNGTYALEAAVYNKDQSGLTGLATVGRFPYVVADPGATYGSAAPQYSILINKDFATTRGFEIALRRRVQNYWGFDISYGYSQSRTNAAEPEREFEASGEGDPELRKETVSEIDQPHNFTGVFRLAVGEDAPDIPFGNLLTHTNLSVVVQARSGLPYTPTFTFNGTGQTGQADRFSGRIPGYFAINLQFRKDWRMNNLRYGFFLNVNNLTDRRNCVQVFTSTGSCVGGAEDQDRRRAGNTVGSNTDSTFFDRPQYIGQRRSIDAGLRIAF